MGTSPQKGLWLRLRRKKGRGKRGPVRRLLRLAVLLAVALYVLCGLMLAGLRWINPPVTMVQVQRRVESLFSERPYEKRQAFVPLERIPADLQHAVVAAEDGRFYQHSGIDWQELQKAFDERERRGSLRGASTISQQLVKNLFFTTHRSPLRKACEVAIVPLAELLLPKRRILELYLNVIEWGPGVYGVEAAARHHYGISAANLSREQAARLAACIPSPLRWRPQNMDTYSSDILARMERMGW
jgi:monofunctional biosynthetic peptidoglycan transglycosylase